MSTKTYSYVATRDAVVPHGVVTHDQLLSLGFELYEGSDPLPATFFPGLERSVPRNHHGPVTVTQGDTLHFPAPLLIPADAD